MTMRSQSRLSIHAKRAGVITERFQRRRNLRRNIKAMDGNLERTDSVLCMSSSEYNSGGVVVTVKHETATRPRVRFPSGILRYCIYNFTACIIFTSTFSKRKDAFIYCHYRGACRIRCAAAEAALLELKK